MNIILFSKNDILSDQGRILNDEGARAVQNACRYVFYRTDDRYSHIKKILKLSEGDVFKAGIINGKIGSGLIECFTEERLVFSFTGTQNPLPLPPVTLILGFPRPIQLKRILRDCASLGLSHLCLTGTELGEKSYLKSGLACEKEVRSYLLDGIVQAGQTLLPEIVFYGSVSECLKNESGFSAAAGKKIVLDIAAGAEPVNALTINKSEIIIAAVGSERGWTDSERQLFADAGFKTYTLGRRILRTETAACSALSVILAHNGFW